MLHVERRKLQNERRTFRESGEYARGGHKRPSSVAAGAFAPSVPVFSRRRLKASLVWRIACAGLVVAALSLAMTATAESAAPGEKVLKEERTTLWAPFVELRLSNPEYTGNPFDVHATATFEHSDSGKSHVTELFYVGDDAWAFRFTGTRTGEWTFATTSPEENLDGWRGNVTVEPQPDPNVRGFLTPHQGKFAIEVDEDGALEGVLYNIYMNHALRERVEEYSADEDELLSDIDEMLAEVEEHGFDGAFLIVGNNWFQYGALGHDEHSSENPDFDTFRIIETIITEAHKRGLHLHIWAWGDDERRWTPIGVGGINEEADRRLQRYIAARLGPLPGWTMSYGFDLYEWVSEEQVAEWADYLHERFGWPKLLTARERHDHDTRIFEFDEGERLDIYSVDDRPEADFYDIAVKRLEDRGLPVLFERRFLYNRDNVWDTETTRRALWQFTMAGGASAIWGVMWGGGEPYPHPEQLRLHGDFWRDRFLLDFEPANHLTDGYALMVPDNTHYVFYSEDADEVRLDLTGMPEAQPVVALDTSGGEAGLIELGMLDPAVHVWEAPYQADWVVAVGRY